ncbi:hypothetical protein JCM10207_000381 [Rhodosporidiobolus poonsookiae]
MLPYVLPITLGLAAVAVTAVILIEVVPQVLEDRQRRERDERRRRRGAVPVAVRASGVEQMEAPSGGWAYKHRLLSPTDSHHVLGDGELTTDLEDNRRGAPSIPLQRLPTVQGSATTTPTALTPMPTGATAVSSRGTAPLFSPALSSASDMSGFVAVQPPSPSSHSHAQNETACASLSAGLDSPTSTLVPSFPPSSVEPSPNPDASPALSSSTFASPTFAAAEVDNPFADAPSTSAQGKILFELPTSDDGLSDGWVRSPTLTAAGSDDGLGGTWTKLSDDEEEGSEARAGERRASVGLGLRSV